MNSAPVSPVTVRTPVSRERIAALRLQAQQLRDTMDRTKFSISRSRRSAQKLSEETRKTLSEVKNFRQRVKNKIPVLVTLGNPAALLLDYYEQDSGHVSDLSDDEDDDDDSFDDDY